MDNRLDEEIGCIEADFICSGKIFTALDVGNELKKKGVNVRQRDVSPIVRKHFRESDIYSEHGYTRTLISVNGSKDQAFLYLHITDDHETYVERDQTALKFDSNKPMFLDDLAQNKAANPNSVCLDNFVGSINSDVYHTKECFYARRIKPENFVPFSDAIHASSMNYHKCRRE
jgi:hypothetical protein